MGGFSLPNFGNLLFNKTRRIFTANLSPADFGYEYIEVMSIIKILK